ncbi:hypothetical protein FDJ25_gp191 [Vibrio phage Aphrodite1]|uniref:Uncharacterized protein n=1 Tax=Vibrio phage Aphrodite1 TaxID=2070057 RepID=A0A2I7QI60_9CAUD|nr:hypothetical protein FDJ25_gp191 [Vibrio phage Aphrodite1]AUR81084.1 hypothetical protein Aphrodite1_0008 [Vibrio phage Aphrodite1]
MSTNLNIWIYDNLNPDDYKDVRAFNRQDYVYCQMEYDTHSEVSLYMGDTRDHRVPVVIMEQLRPEVFLSHLNKLAEQERERIIVFVPDYPELLEVLDKNNYNYHPASGD